MIRAFRALLCFALLAALLLLAPSAFAGLRVAAWNIQHLGWGEKKDYGSLVEVLERFDLIAVVELMRPEALEQLERMLEAKTGESWSSMRAMP